MPVVEDRWIRCRANKAHIRQSRPDSGLGCKTVKARFWPELQDSQGQILALPAHLPVVDDRWNRCRVNVAHVRQPRPESGCDCLIPATRAGRRLLDPLSSECVTNKTVEDRIWP